MLTSMTGMASMSGASGPYDWSMELRGVNNKGLDIRTRVPEWLAGFDQIARKDHLISGCARIIAIFTENFPWDRTGPAANRSG
jgi:hypothetical protein